MIAVANNSVVVINNLTSRRASVIANRTNSEAMGVIKAQMIDLLKAKLHRKPGGIKSRIKKLGLEKLYGARELGAIKVD